MKKNPMKTTTPTARNSITRSRLRYGLFFIPLALAWFALSPTTRAQLSPPPDGGYPNDNTAEGTDALFSLTTGSDNTAIGFEALFSDTTGDSNTATGSQALVTNTTGVRNTADGFATLSSNTTGERNTATGRAALAFNTTGTNNTADGHDALFSNDTGIRNAASGSFALFFNTAGNHNTAMGYFASFNNTTGNLNVALGDAAGSNLTTGDNNLDIGSLGVAAEANTIRIGTVVAASDPVGLLHPVHTATYIAGISGTPVSGVAVKITSSGQLGVPPSSKRFKDEIKPMDKTSEVILALKPVTFRYKKGIDPDRTPQFGLVAEEVEKVNPDLVTRDTKGELYTVRYDAVNAMLLNEFLKEHKTVQKQGATIARLQKQIETLAAGLQKVSAEVELQRPSAQTVANNQ
jgi:hypothetical protein